MIVFENNGLLDERAITTFGVSSKETDSAIGFFGTGLKYAIAILLRHSCEVTIFIGHRQFSFTSQREKIRVDEFDTVFMQEHMPGFELKQTRLGFTTELGKTWELWQAYRELYCNTLDESGTIAEESSTKSEEGKTKVLVTGSGFEAIHRERDAFILTRNDEPQASHVLADVYRTSQGKNLFYRSMKALQSEQPFLKTWNLKTSIDLTEDRTIKWDFMARRRMCDMVCQSEDEDFIREIVTCGDNYYEGKLDFFYSTVLTQCFRDTVRKAAEANPSGVNGTAMQKANVSMGDLLPKEGIVMDDIDMARMDKACTFCEGIGFPVREYPIIVMDHIEVGVHGLAHDGKIFIAKACFNNGTKYLASTLIEEFVHLRFKHFDLTRELQTFLFDQVIGLGERLTGEPL